MSDQVTDADLPHLRRCVELAAVAVEAGDFPFGSVLAAADGTVLAEDRNREMTEGWTVPASVDTRPPSSP
ncbi:MAG: hypothetical protein ACRDPO_08890 [Streptosporangiaceae bacterium]